jgi:hypothetical protein
MAGGAHFQTKCSGHLSQLDQIFAPKGEQELMKADER